MNAKFKYLIGPIIFVIIVFIMFISFAYLTQRIVVSNREHYENSVSEEILADMHNRFDVYILRIKSMETYVESRIETGIDYDDFYLYASGLFGNDESLEDISIAPNGVHEFVYPTDYDDIVGHNLFEDEREYIVEAATRAMNDNEVVISGPYPNRTDLSTNIVVIRYPVYYDNGEFYGLINVVLKTTVLFQPNDSSLYSDIEFNIIDNKQDVLYGPNLVNPIHSIENRPLEYFEWEISYGRSETYTNSINNENRKADFAFFLIGFMLLIGGFIFVKASYNSKVSKEKAISELKESERQLRRTIDEAPVPIMLHAEDGEVIKISRAWTEMTGYTHADIPTTKLWAEKAYGIMQDEVLSVITTTYDEDHKQIDSEFTVNSKFGNDLIWDFYSAHIGKLPDGREMAMSVAIDITERKQFEKAMTEAEASSEAKNIFLANMSHEIRTPLNAIIGINYLIQKTQLTDLQRDYMERTNLAAHNLLEHVNDVLDFSKIEANKITLENNVFDLYEVINNVCTIISFNLYEKQLKLVVTVESNVPQLLIGDAHRLNQVLLNIINNSIKFTVEGEIKIVIRKNSQIDQGISLTFDVIDSGVGMSDEQQKDIFAPFLQANNSTTRKFGGTGLGLSISKGIVELMGGHISVNSKIDVGSTFSFTADFGWHDQINYEIEQIKALDYLKVLLVSSNNNMQEIFAKEFSLLGISIDMCSGLNDAIRILQSKSNYNAILLDWTLLNEHTVREQIKSMVVDPMLKVMAISTSRDYHMEMLDHVDIVNTIIYNPIGLRQLHQKLSKTFSDIKTPEQESSNKVFAINQGHILKGIKLLLVEDNELNREIVITILEEYGLIIDSAENGRIALEKLLKESYDIVLMDLQMPEMDGYVATKKIREIDRLMKLPIIAMSAHAVKGLEEVILNTGMNDYITKPFEVSKMISTLEFWAGKHK